MRKITLTTNGIVQLNLQNQQRIYIYIYIVYNIRNIFFSSLKSVSSRLIIIKMYAVLFAEVHMHRHTTYNFRCIAHTQEFCNKHTQLISSIGFNQFYFTFLIDIETRKNSQYILTLTIIYYFSVIHTRTHTHPHTYIPIHTNTYSSQ